ncbi:MAG: hypothetical protein LBD75_02590 [Candidatus Peribacteria bacterium]|nr:hypothetical protein [Candidatus Peribacteria bacterium]
MLQFRKAFYLNGLGEFMVVNGLSPQKVARFVSSPHHHCEDNEASSGVCSNPNNEQLLDCFSPIETKPFAMT